MNKSTALRSSSAVCIQVSTNVDKAVQTKPIQSSPAGVRGGLLCETDPICRRRAGKTIVKAKGLGDATTQGGNCAKQTQFGGVVYRAEQTQFWELAAGEIPTIPLYKANWPRTGRTSAGGEGDSVAEGPAIWYNRCDQEGLLSGVLPQALQNISKRGKSGGLDLPSIRRPRTEEKPLWRTGPCRAENSSHPCWC